MSEQSGAPRVSVLAAADFRPEAGLEGVEVVRLDGDGIAALSAGLRAARGELAVHLPPGDELVAGGLRRLLAGFAGRPDVVLLYPAYISREGELENEVVPEEMSFTEMLMFQQVPVGPGAVFRRAPALAAAEAAAGHERLAMFSFWLRLAAAGRVLRLVDTLARRRAVATPAAPARELARERLDLLEAIAAEVKAPDRREDVLRSAARSACILAAQDFEGGPQGPEERFSVSDRHALPDQPIAAGGDPDAELAALEARLFAVDQLHNRTKAVLPFLEEMVGQREARLAGESGRRAQLRRKLRKAVGR